MHYADRHARPWRTAAGLSLAVGLQAGVWLALQVQPARLKPVAAAKRDVLVRFLPLPSAVPPPRLVPALPRPARVARAVAPRVVTATPVVAAVDAPATQEAETASQPLDVGQLKASAAKLYLQGTPAVRPAVTSNQAALSATEQFGQKMQQAARPKCDHNYVPKVGMIQFDGLMKLPFLVASAVSDKGCKW
ncbi:MAG TPA: hypothetical protein VIT92_13755 [Burkholderiaceae bacterium]